MVNQSVVGAPFISMLQTMHLANGSQNFEKNGNFSGIRAKAFRKRSVLLTRVEIRSLEIIIGETFKIEILFESLRGIMRRWGNIDHRLVQGFSLELSILKFL